MKIPPYLQKGDTVAIVATARKTTEDELQEAVSLLESWGITVIIGNSIGLENNQLAGSDEERAADFEAMTKNPDVKAIWCARGGYGTVRMVDLVDFSALKKNPKWVIGYSDVTVLHSHINNMNAATIHSVMATGVTTATDDTKETLRKALFGETLQYTLPPHTFNKYGKANGQLTGGNLSVLYSIIGSRSEMDCEDKILFIEDLDEYLYHIDRMMMNLKRNHYFEKIKGLIIGGMNDMNDNKTPWGHTALEIIKDITNEYNIPICFNFPAGHTPTNCALVLGKQITLTVNENGTQVTFN
ncbi:peptidase S66 [Flavobacterium suaedae]|uniref:Peptidase S66 n=1 Tax=Flavobacterium suaedae TaxID=1767027 RepID=A0ABQ1JV27_9FLAO|nr:LD-carboxypeptidase [Flavobacterium suaedae]GGB78922.1 peptidase S66 [Flavobacterium suaedae]